MRLQPISANNNYNNNFYNKNKHMAANSLTAQQPAFQGGKKPGKITEFFAKYYAKHIADSDKVRNFSERISKMDKGDVTRHFQVLGSLITSSAYMHSTLKNKEMDRDNARTLAVNQGLNFLLPTAAAYTVDLAIRQINKQLEYKYSAIQEAKNTALTGEAKKEAEKLLGKKLKGFRTLIGIVTFTLIYRFVAPVAITPIANAIGRWINGNNKNKEASQADKQQAVAAAKS